MNQDKDKVSDALNEAEKSLKRAVDFYNQLPDPNEISLVDMVRRALVENGVQEQQLREAYDCDRFVIESAGKHAHAQQFNLNRYFANQLSYVDAEGGDTRLIRYQLIYEITPSEWFKIVKDSVIPNLVDFNLPRAYHGYQP